MGLFDFVKSGVREMMIARPDDKKHLIVWKWPDQNVPMFSQLTVDSDEAAVFFRDGRVVGVLPGGQRYTLSTQNLPFLNNLINQFTGGDIFIAEIFFVKTQPVRGIPVGGPVGEMIDPLTGEMVCPRMFGEFSVVVADPARFVVGYVGQASAGDNDEVLNWVKQLFLLGVKTALGEVSELEGKSMLQAVSLTQTLAQRFVAKCPSLEDIGVRVYQMGNFNINFSPDDRKRLQEANAEVAKAQRQVRVKEAEARGNQYGLDQKFNQDARYVQNLAGNWQNYAAGSAMMGAGQGMAQGGDGGLAGAGAQMAVGVGLGNALAHNFATPQGPQFNQGVQGQPPAQYGQPPQQYGQPPQAAGAEVACPKCSAKNPVGAKFCINCGSATAPPQPRPCSSCQAMNGPGAKFCANCGNNLSAQQAPG
jgi:membrane protease subunit (stomatin/prohibitin family)